MKKFFQEFKEFAMRGNVLDMAVGVVVGSAFTAIVTSIVQNLLTPLLGLLIPDSTFAEWAPGGFGIGAVCAGAFLAGAEPNSARISSSACSFSSGERSSPPRRRRSFSRGVG